MVVIVLCVVCVALTGAVVFLVIDRRIERREVVAERQVLLQRIQAPDVAIIDHQLGKAWPVPQAPGFEDDDAFHASRDELAAGLERP